MLHHYVRVLCSYPGLHFKNYSKYHLFWWPCVFLKLSPIPVFPNQGSGELLGSLKSLGVFWDFDLASINYVVVLLILSRKYNSSGAYLTVIIIFVAILCLIKLGGSGAAGVSQILLVMLICLVMLIEFIVIRYACMTSTR